MSMSPVMKSVIKSYARGVMVAITPLVATNITNPWAYAVAIFAGVISPALRAMDKNDPAFGAVADIAEVELNKQAEKFASKKKTK
jgi:hypothetical protein